MNPLAPTEQQLHALRDPAATPIDRAAAADRLVDQVRVVLVEMVDQARMAGHSWNAIGAALGTTRQAARERFGEPDPLQATDHAKAPPDPATRPLQRHRTPPGSNDPEAFSWRAERR